MDTQNDKVEFPTIDCWYCDGTGETVEEIKTHRSNLGNEEVVLQDIAEHKCGHCRGFGYMTKNHTAYKSQAMADRHQAKLCFMCSGHGVVQSHQVKKECRRCRASGKTLVWSRDGNTIPEEIDLFLGSHTDFLDEYFSTVNFEVIGYRDSQTWGEHNLGRGIVSVTDYGAAWDICEDSPAVLAEMVRSDFQNKANVQLIKLVDRDTRRIGDTIYIDVSRNGYSVFSSAEGGEQRVPWSTYKEIVDEPIVH